MSDLLINVRFLFWHFKLRYNGKYSVTFNQYHWQRKIPAIIRPIQVYDWELKKE